MPRLIYVVNIPRFFVSHRLPLALAAQQAGYEVHIATSEETAGVYDSESLAAIRASGLPFHPLPLAQHGTNPFSEVRLLAALVRLYRQLQPDLVHQVSIKPVLYGGLAAHLTGVQGIVSAMSGLGYVFLGEGAKARLLQRLIHPVLRLALMGRNTRMIFQNSTDQDRFVRLGYIQAQQARLIRGSGVEMARFSPQPEAEGLPVVLFAGRLMWQKGVGEFVQAARHINAQGRRARFVVVGYSEATSPSTVSPSQLQAWAEEGIIEWWGKRTDMPQVFAESHIVCLPSSYGEGVPKVLIEAAACGRAIVTTDSAGCNDICQHEVNGLLVPVGEQSALEAALLRLIEDRATRQRYGAEGRLRAEREFALPVIIAQTLAVYEELLTS